MTRRILVPIDGSPPGWTALEFASEQFPDAAVTVLHVIDPIDGGFGVRTGLQRSSEEWYEEAKSESEALFEEARERTADSDLTVETAVEVGRPSRVVVEHSEEGDFDQVIMGSHGRSGVSRILLGSVAETVVRRSSVPVTVVR
jgi:nucleotide-binding universal stress UspA family protein